MKKYIIFLFLIFLSGIGYSQTFDSSFTVFNSLRGNVWFKKSNVPSYLIDGYRAKIVNGDTLVRGNFGVLRAEEIEVYSDGSDMASAFQSAIDFTAVNWVSFGSDSVRSYIFASSINVHGKTLDFSNGNKLVASGSISVDSLTYRASDYDQVFEGDITFTNLKSATGHITPNHFGAKGDGTTNDTDPLQKSMSVPNITLKLVGRYLITDSVTLHYSNNIETPSGAAIVGNHTTIIGSYDDANLVAMRDKTYSIRVERADQSDWSDTNDIGVKFVNINYAKVNFVSAKKFTIGVKTVGYDAGDAYTDWNLGMFDGNMVGFWIATESIGGEAWNNQHNYWGGWFRVGSSVNVGKQRWAWWIGSGSYNVTNNVISGNSIEIGTPAVGYLLKSASRSHIKDFRWESDGDSIAIAQGTSANNIFLAMRGSSTGKLFDFTNNGTNYFNKAETYYTEKTEYTTVVAMDNIAELCSYSGDDSSVNIRYPGLLQYRTGASLTYPVSTMDKTAQIENDYMLMDAGHLYGISTNLIDVSVVKSFVVKTGLAAGSSPISIGFTLYNSKGVNITSTSSVKTNLSISYSTTYGGVLFDQNTSGRDVNVTFPDTAAKVRVVIFRGSGTVLPKSLRIVTHDPMAPIVYSKFNGQQYYNTSPTKPSIGNYLQNRLILNSAPAKDSPYAWICTASGTFGELPPMTGSITNNTNKLVLSTGGGTSLRIGNVLQIGTKRLEVVGIDADTAYLNGTAPSTLSGIAIDYAVPVFEVVNYVDASGGVTLSQLNDSLNKHNAILTNVGNGDTIFYKISDTSGGFKSLVAPPEVITPTDTTLVFNMGGDEYTASLTNSTNVASSTGADFRYIRVGNIVMVSGKVSVTPTAGTANTIIRVSLPIASALASGADLWGSGSATETTRVVVDVEGTDATDEAIISFTSISTSAHIVKVHFTYTIN